MEASMKLQENQNPSLISSPDSRSSNSSSSSGGGGAPPATAAGSQNPAAAAVPVTRSDPNSPYRTTFVQADASSFKRVVQMLTGSSEKRPDPTRIPPIKTGSIKKEKSGSGSKLYERRNSMKNFKINPTRPGFVSGSTRPGEILSPSMLDFPSLVLSPVTPLIPDPFTRSGHSAAAHGAGDLNMAAEEKAIAKKGFYLHPSPANTPKNSEPQLLPLFPLTSPNSNS